MGKAARNQKMRGSRRGRADLLEKLAESHQFLERSAVSFDNGYDAEAKRLAVVLRVLLHDTKMSHSLLRQLGVKNSIGFVDTAEPINPNNLLPTPGLLMMRMTQTSDGAVGNYVAPLDMERPHGSRIVDFADWWESPVMKVDDTWSRKELVLTLANEEGGAHVDPDINDSYDDLARHNGLGWITISGGESAPLVGNAIAIGVRQITYEYLKAVDREGHLFS